MRENDFKSKFKSSAEVLKSLFDDKKKGGVVSDQFLRWKLWMQWSELVGPSIAEYTEPVSYRDGVLWLWVKNSTWMQQMTFMSDSIKNVIEQKFRKGYVREIRFTLDRKALPGRDDMNFQKSVKKFTDGK
jgi:predicted nucleic acid-binding Zn ribbon protein